MVLVIVVVVGADSCFLFWYPVFEYSEYSVLILQESPYVDYLYTQTKINQNLSGSLPRPVFITGLKNKKPHSSIKGVLTCIDQAFFS